ncbi:MAG: Smr/MutS family protein, partial [Chloroflexi bacterium]|nr:Smr/MutS family protein [Chloroflexota bacterium]
QLDIALAKARYAEKARAIEPFIAGAKGTEAAAGQKAGALRFVNARHPLLTGEVVPLSLNLGDKYRVLVISGPNTGGKTVALKTIGLLAVMVQAGLPVPVGEGTCLPVFDSIFADIGDEQSIEQTLSTFSWHMGNIVRIIEGCTGRSLVLLDELGTSTDPSEGIALARAILLHFCDRGVMSVATTHYNDLKIAAQTTPGMRNASFDFDPQSLKPTYHLTFGVPGSSNALAIAARLGLPQELILTAREMQSKAAWEVEAVLRDLTAERQKAAELRADLQRAAQEMESRGVAFEAEMQTLREQEQASFREVKTRLFREAADLRRQIRLASAELKKATSKKAVERARRTMAAFHERLSADNLSVETPLAQKKAPAMAAVEPLSVGDRVWLGDVGVWGTVTAAPDPEGQVEAQVGNVRLKLDSQEVERRPEEGEQARQFAVVRRGSRTGLSSLELDLRGRRAEQVEPELDAYLNEAFLAHLPEVRVIHGFGTGAVRQIARDLLATHPLVKSFRPGGRGEGGDGVTMVTLSVRS